MEKKVSNIAQQKSYDFALRTIKLYQFLNNPPPVQGCVLNPYVCVFALS